MRDDDQKRATDPVSAPANKPQSHGGATSDEETLLRSVRAHLAEQIQSGAVLTGFCQVYATHITDGVLDAVNAAARIGHAQAALAKAFARHARCESRHRVIVEHAPRHPDWNDSISSPAEVVPLMLQLVQLLRNVHQGCTETGELAAPAAKEGDDPDAST